MTSTGSLPIHQLIVSTKWPPSPTKREPSSSLSRYQLSDGELSCVDQVPGVCRLGRSPERCRISTRSGANRRLNPTMTRSLPVASTVARMRSSSSDVSASGFSTNTAFPASSARHVSSAWELCRVTMNTASIVGSSKTASGSVPACPKPNLRCALTADKRAAGGHVGELDPRLIREMRKKHRRGVVPGADKADPQGTPAVDRDDGLATAGRGAAALVCLSRRRFRTRPSA